MTVIGNADRLLASRPVRIGLAIGVGLAARAVAGRATLRPAEGLVDWDRAQRMAQRRLVRAPGHLTDQQLRATRSAYARHMARVVPLLERRLGADLPGVVERHAVASRTEWAAANMSTFKTLVAHLEPSLRPRGPQGSLRVGVASAANRLLTTSQVGFLLGYLGTRVLGQYDVALLSAEQAPGRLLYVEENIRATARAVGVPLETFRLWVCLHETTHAFELEAHPWLRPYLRERLERQVMLFAEQTRHLQRQGLRYVVSRWRAATAEGSWRGLLEPEQRTLFRETQAVMSLMEGFSDWVMDEVGAELIPDVASIRHRFEMRRGQRRRGIDRILARLTGMDLKLEQYRRGERFVAGVHDLGGRPAIARLWDGPETLPTEQELDDPAAWLARIMPTGAESPAHVSPTDAPAGRT
jgi:coenzyme F420 biosynthesis associated uncharacterized protein